jgi:putative tricarboxylic transport membrane protein
MFKNAGAGAVLLVLSLGYYLAADAMPTSILDTTVPSSAFPKLLAILGAVLSAALIVQNIVTVAIAGRPAADPDEPQQSFWEQHRRALGLLAIVAAFIVALEIVGYPVSIVLLILAVSVYQGYPLSWISVGVAVLGGLFFWLFFMVLLGIHMPLGIVGKLFAGAGLHFPFA